MDGDEDDDGEFEDEEVNLGGMTLADLLSGMNCDSKLFVFNCLDFCYA